MVERMRDLNSQFRMHTSSYKSHSPHLVAGFTFGIPTSYKVPNFSSRESKEPIQSIHRRISYARPVVFGNRIEKC